MAFTTAILPARDSRCEVQYVNFLDIFSVINPSMSKVSPKGASNNLEIVLGSTYVKSKLSSQVGFEEDANKYPTLFSHSINKPKA